MSGSFDNNGSKSDPAGKRPTPTIEGTATEVSVEAEASDDAKADETSPEVESDSKSPQDTGLIAPEADDETDADGEDTAKLKTAETEKRSLGASLLAALTSFTTHAAAGILGGVLVLLAIGLGYVPLPSATAPDDLTPLEKRISKLESTPRTPDNTAALKALESKLADFENRTPETPRELASLSERVTLLESSLKSMAEAAKDGGSVADAAAISRQINEAETRLDAKIDEAMTKVETADVASVTALKKEVASIAAKLKALTEAELSSGDTSRLAPEVTELGERLDRLEATLPPLLDAVDQQAEDTRAATLAMAFASLRAAVDSGRPYATELSTLAALSPGTGDLGGLLDYEDDGIPTLRQLTVSFKEIRATAPAEVPASDEDSLVGRLMSSAESLVKVKRIDANAEGDTPDAVLARAEAKLEEGDLAGAVSEVATLKGPQEAAFAEWLDQARARLDAENSLGRLQKVLLVSLNRKAPSSGGETDDTAKEKAPE